MGQQIMLFIFLVLIVLMAVVCGILVRKAEIEKKNALEEAARVKTEFLSRVNKDIKTPMNVIVGMTALGLEQTDQPDKVRECLEKIHMASGFLMQLLGDLVDMSKIENGHFRLHPKPYAINDFIEKVHDRMDLECRKKRIAFHMSNDMLNLNIMVDPARFEQLFFNLMSNAVQFTPEGGEISFRICNYAVHSELFSADYVVEDNGIGMSEDFQRLLFEPFTQEKRSQAEKNDGAGLGLAISRNIVDQMGGTIQIESELGKGTKVKVHLEVELASIQPEKSGEWIDFTASKKILEGKRVLLVEDHPLNEEVAKHILESQGVQVTCAKNGQQALERFIREDSHTFDAILMDIYMPEMDGLMTSRRIRKVKRMDAQTIPIIAMSASDAPEDIVACKEAGMNAHVAKPVEPRKLYRVLCEYLEYPF
ncbi:MAG: response regulator [Roseburia sp.]|nr:response regulator [Roseburia sp.]